MWWLCVVICKSRFNYKSPGMVGMYVRGRSYLSFLWTNLLHVSALYKVNARKKEESGYLSRYIFGLYNRQIVIRFPAGVGVSCLHSSTQTDFGPNPSILLFSGYGGALSPGIKRPGPKADHASSSTSRVENESSFTTTSPSAIMACTGTIVPLHYPEEVCWWQSPPRGYGKYNDHRMKLRVLCFWNDCLGRKFLTHLLTYVANFKVFLCPSTYRYNGDGFTLEANYSLGTFSFAQNSTILRYKPF